MTEPLTKLFQALKNDKLPDYLMGRNGYRFQDDWAEVPTNLTTVFLDGFNAYVRLNEANKGVLESKLHEALSELLKSQEGAWWAVSIVFSYFCEFKENILAFSIDVNRIVPSINASLSKFKDSLKVNKSWTGWRFENGLWDDIVYVVPKINEKLTRANAPMRIELIP